MRTLLLVESDLLSSAGGSLLSWKVIRPQDQSEVNLSTFDMKTGPDQFRPVQTRPNQLPKCPKCVNFRYILRGVHWFRVSLCLLSPREMCTLGLRLVFYWGLNLPNITRLQRKVKKENGGSARTGSSVTDLTREEQEEEC